MSVTPKTQDQLSLPALSSNLAASLLLTDWPLAILCAILLAFPSVLLSSTKFGAENDLVVLCIIATQHLLELFALAYISSRIFSKLRQSPSRLPSGDFARLIFFGVLYWLAYRIPGLLIMVGLSNPKELSSLISISGFLLMIGLYFAYRYFFYFFPILLGISKPREVLRSAMEYLNSNAWLPLYCLLPPWALYLFICSLVVIFDPDGRYRQSAIVLSALEPIPLVIGIYLQLGVALAYANDSTWLQQKFTPYRRARLETISLGAPVWLTWPLSLRNAMVIFGVAVMIWLGNSARALSIPPSGTYTVASIEVNEKLLTLQVNASDPEVHFHNFQPSLFSLRGEKEAPIVAVPKSIFLGSTQLQAIVSLPSDLTEAQFKVTFEASRSGKDLIALEDLYLWYKNVKIQKLDMKAAVLISPAETDKKQAEDPKTSQDSQANLEKKTL